MKTGFNISLLLLVGLFLTTSCVKEHIVPRSGAGNPVTILDETSTERGER